MATHGGAESNGRAHPRILCVADEHPWPERTGYRIRLANVLRALAAVGSVDLLVLHGDAPGECTVPPGEPVDALWTAPVPAPMRTWAGLGAWLRSDLPRRVVWRDWSAATRELGRVITGPYDLVWWSHLDSWVAIGDAIDVPAIVDLDNLEDRWLAGRTRTQRQDGTGRSLRGAVAARLDAIDVRRWHRLQARAATTATAIVCSEADRSVVLDAAPGGRVAVIPNGFATPTPRVGHPARAVSATGGVIVFVGLLTYEPNLDGARFLVEQVLPPLRELRPDVTLHLVGRAGPEAEALASAGVRVLGEVADVGAALAAADVVAVPIRFGGGTRIKVLEAMAQHIPIVTTTIGGEGLDLRPGVDAEIADDAVAFARACAALLDDPARRVAMTEAAAARHAAAFDWSAIGARIEAAAVAAMVGAP